MPEQEKPKSDQLRRATMEEYLAAQSHPDKLGWKGFVKSNLFSALVIFVLTQIAGAAIMVYGFYTRVNTIDNWKSGVDTWRGQADQTLKRMDDFGTFHGHYTDERQDKSIAALEIKMDRMESETQHLDVLESEHRRLTSDVERLKDGKK